MAFRMPWYRVSDVLTFSSLLSASPPGPTYNVLGGRYVVWRTAIMIKDKGIAKPKAEVISAADSFFTKALNSKLNLEASAELTSHLPPPSTHVSLSERAIVSLEHFSKFQSSILEIRQLVKANSERARISSESPSRA
jgi:hypothetical protein